MEHELKVLPRFFAALKDGSKSFEVRRDDRPFSVGDRCWFHEWSPEIGYHHSLAVGRDITYILRGEEAERFGVQPGYCVLAVPPC